MPDGFPLSAWLRGDGLFAWRNYSVDCLAVQPVNDNREVPDNARGAAYFRWNPVHVRPQETL